MKGGIILSCLLHITRIRRGQAPQTILENVNINFPSNNPTHFEVFHAINNAFIGGGGITSLQLTNISSYHPTGVPMPPPTLINQHDNTTRIHVSNLIHFNVEIGIATNLRR